MDIKFMYLKKYRKLFAPTAFFVWIVACVRWTWYDRASNFLTFSFLTVYHQDRSSQSWVSSGAILDLFCYNFLWRLAGFYRCGFWNQVFAFGFNNFGATFLLSRHLVVLRKKSSRIRSRLVCACWMWQMTLTSYHLPGLISSVEIFSPQKMLTAKEVFEQQQMQVSKEKL